MMLWLPICFANHPDNPWYPKRHLMAVVTPVMVILAVILLQVILCGSYPLGYDADGTERLRMIPFIPWPDRPFWGS
jgi:hypothetical protein